MSYGRADGSIVIEAVLDNKDALNGIKSIEGAVGGLKSVVKKLGAAIGIAFSVGAIVQFGKESVQAANELSAALTGLQSILDGQGRSFSDAQKFIEEYTKDGLIPATNAITAYKNLAMRGYDDSQIRQVMVALKDASAFGRQASYTMGEAVQTATEGLKNENSILVDNAGVTKNVAKMWEEYAASIGTTANNLTQQQKIQAEVNGILEESKYQVGDAAKVAGTLTGQLTQLSFNFYNLKVAVGNAINPIVQSFLPVINTAVQTLTRFANAIASVVGALFGKASVQSSALADQNSAVASSAAAGADAEEELADATKAAGQAAQKSLAPFDELNKLSDTSSGSGGSASGGAVGGTGASTSIASDVQVEDTISPKLQAIVDKIKELVEPLKNIDFGPAVAAFERLKEAVAPLTAKLFAGLEWAWYNILVPLAEWTIEDLLPAFLDLLSAALVGLNTAIDGLMPLGQWLWEEFLKPIAEWTGGVIVDSINGLAEALTKISDWISEHQEGISNFAILLGSIAGSFGAVTVISSIARAISDISLLMSGTQIAVSPLLGTIMSWIAEIGMAFSSVGTWISGLISTIGTALAGIAAALGISVGWLVAIVAAVAVAAAAIIIYWDEIKAFFTETIPQIWEQFVGWLGGVLSEVGGYFGEAWESIKEYFSPATEWFTQLWDSVSQTFSDVFYNIGVIASGCWEIIKAVWGVVSDWFCQNVVAPVSDFFTGMWEGLKTGAREAWEGVKSAFSTVATFFGDIFRSAWQKVVEVFSPLGEIFVNIKDGILTAFKQIVNGIIEGLNYVISVPFNGINNSLMAIKGFSIMGVQPFGGLRAISVPQIPYLAQGAVIPPNHEFMAVLGDQRHGTNIEAPLSTIEEAVSKVTASAEQIALLREQNRLLQAILENSGVYLDGRKISETVTKYQKLARRAGYNLI
ncbi:MAG: hypothetical protein ACI3WQ_04570 [Faecousia sp.]